MTPKLILTLLSVSLLGHPGHSQSPAPGASPSRSRTVSVQLKAPKPSDQEAAVYTLPTIKIGAPEQVDPGELVVVSAAVDPAGKDPNLQKIKFQWTVFEDGKAGKVRPSIVVWPDGSQLFFAAGLKARTVLVQLDVDCLYGVPKVVDGATLLGEADIYSPPVTTLAIVVAGSDPGPAPGPGPGPSPDPDPGPGPDPGPQPQPDPTFEDGTYKLAAFVYQTLKADASLTPQEKTKVGPAFAGVCEGVASKIVAVSTYRDLQQILKDLTAANVAALSASGIPQAKISTFSNAVGAHIYDMYSNQRTIKNSSDVVVALRELATGLKAFAPKARGRN